MGNDEYVSSGVFNLLTLGSGLWERGAADLTEEVVTAGANKGIIMLGHMEDGYVNTAVANGYRHFTAPEGLYCPAANRLFVDETVIMGDQVNLSRSINAIREGSVLSKEVQHLFNYGYVEINPTTLIPK